MSSVLTVQRYVRKGSKGETIIGLCGHSGEHVELVPATVDGKQQLKAVWSRCRRLEYVEPDATPITLDKVPEALLPRLGFVRVPEKAIAVELVTDYRDNVGQVYSYRIHNAGGWAPQHVLNYGKVESNSSMRVAVTKFRNNRPYKILMRIENHDGKAVEVDFEAERRKAVFELKQGILRGAGYSERRVKLLINLVGPTYAVYAHDWLCDVTLQLLQAGFVDPQRQLQATLRRGLADRQDGRLIHEISIALYNDFGYVYFEDRNLVDLAKGALFILDTGCLPRKTMESYLPSLNPEDYKLSQEVRRLHLRKEQEQKVLLDTVLGTA